MIIPHVCDILAHQHQRPSLDNHTLALPAHATSCSALSDLCDWKLLFIMCITNSPEMMYKEGSYQC